MLQLYVYSNCFNVLMASLGNWLQVVCLYELLDWKIACCLLVGDLSIHATKLLVTTGNIFVHGTMC